MTEKVVVAISGGGRTLANLLEKQKGKGLRYEVAGVISSSDTCKGLTIARKENLPTFIGDFSKEVISETEIKLHDWLKRINPQWIALGGFLKLMPLFPEWRERTINIHPALLPNFGGKGMYGANVHKAVIESGAKESGASIHFVDEKYDEGSIIAQIKVPVLKDDTPETLAARVFEAECQLYPKVLDALIRKELPLTRGKIKFYEVEKN